MDGFNEMVAPGKWGTREEREIYFWWTPLKGLTSTLWDGVKSKFCDHSSKPPQSTVRNFEGVRFGDGEIARFAECPMGFKDTT